MDSAFANLVPEGLFIGGKWQTTDRRFADVNPATEEPFAEVADASVGDVDAAIAAARSAADDGEWSRTPSPERSMALTSDLVMISTPFFFISVARACRRSASKPRSM